MNALRRLCVRCVVLGVVAVVVFAGSVASAQPPNTTYYAAIAYSKSTGKYGYTSGWLSEVNARRDALANCKADDAVVVLMVGNGYAALAVGDEDSAYGYGYDENSAAEAKRHPWSRAASGPRIARSSFASTPGPVRDGDSTTCLNPSATVGRGLRISVTLR